MISGIHVRFKLDTLVSSVSSLFYILASFFFNLNLFILIGGQLLYNMLLVLPYISMNPPRCTRVPHPEPPELLIYVCIGCGGPLLLHMGFLWLWRAWATFQLQYVGFSLWWALLWSTGSRSQGLQQLQVVGSRVLVQ